MHKRRVLTLVSACAALVAGCDGPSPQEKAAADARDIAAVEAANKRMPPPQLLSPKPILFPDIRKAGLYGPGCAFAPEGGGLGAIVMTEAKRAAIRPRDELVLLASDSGSTPMPQGTWSHYVGKQYALTLTRDASATDERSWAGKLVITDPHDQVVYEAKGLVQCKS